MREMGLGGAMQNGGEVMRHDNTDDIQGEILDTSSWLTFPKNAFTRAISYNALRAPSRMADITDLLTGRSLGISR